MQNRIGAILLALIGVGMIAFGIHQQSAAVTCDNQVMTPGDQCIRYSDSSRTAYTFDEYAGRQHTQGVVITVFGVALLGYAGYTAVRESRRDRDDAAAAMAWQQGA
ncbi:hypothetical protein Cs7R123_29430 [Catellatospora sp. TT07R-123]|uniref:hypothetical protein n=1 Tax=Catellatospora sp. TT07R-123 TaxID=2733863 RepID=UPI001B23D6BD|nr:hypothetical protein [Catellatospora sp. TT07R-123]GHJ45601.1 hypothetical protein Cs7R123_29430 [Catellatospora sp. TT07R-123]